MVQALLDGLGRLGAVPLPSALLVVAVFLTGAALVAVRWREALAMVGGRLGLVHAIVGIFGAQFVNTITPASRIGGEVFRVGWTRAKAGVDVKHAAAGVAIDRVSDLVPVGLVLLASLPVVAPRVRAADVRLVALVAAAVAVALGLVVLLARRRIAERFRVLRIHLHLLAPGWRRHAVVVTGLSLLAWTCDPLRLLAVAAAFDVRLGFSRAALLVIMTIAGNLVPTFGGIGAVEGGLVAALVWTGVPVETAVAITLLERAVSLVLATALGGVALVGWGGTRIWSAMRATLRRPRGAPMPVVVAVEPPEPEPEKREKPGA